MRCQPSRSGVARGASEHHSPVPPPEPANAHTVSAPSALRPQAPLENRQLIDLMSLRLTRNCTRSCGRTVREGHARASSATTPNTKTDPAMVERTLPPTSNNRKQGKRLGTKPRQFKPVAWVQATGAFSGSGLIFEADSDGTFSRLRRLA